jgi:hypothetical protein
MQFKRLVALLALAAGFVGIPVCIVGAFAAWSLAARLERTNAIVFAMINKGLAAAEDRARSVQERIKESKITGAELDRRFRDWGTRKAKEGLVSQLDIEGRAEKLSGHFKTADAWLEISAESVRSVQQVLELGNSIGAPLDPVSVQEALSTIMSLQNTLQETERKVEEIREFAANKAGESEETRLARVTKLLGRVLVMIGEMDTRLEDSVTRLSELQTNAGQLKAKTSDYLLVASIACYVFLAWIAAGQAALSQWGWSNRKRPVAGHFKHVQSDGA